jgi:hypothetical protein
MFPSSDSVGLMLCFIIAQPTLNSAQTALNLTRTQLQYRSAQLKLTSTLKVRRATEKRDLFSKPINPN